MHHLQTLMTLIDSTGTSDYSTGNGVVVKVENLWKQYRLGSINHGTLVRDLQSWWARVRRHQDPNSMIDQVARHTGHLKSTDQLPDEAARDSFWALQDIHFDVRQGEVLGIIGKNGAGKSTLLKILSQVTTPTRGQIKIRGRVASLLEVGTGFHPELTGLENIFLNGAILGMSKQDIRRKLDEIVAFAEVEKFLETPVKRYSSGMYVRLAFSVAAHLEPEILVVDEVLAVGDASFQKKCIGKMHEIGQQGRTILFVSHNMGAIVNLCSRAVLLEGGRKTADGKVDEVVNGYLAKTAAQRITSYQCQEPPNDRAWIAAAALRNAKGEPADRLLMTEPLTVECDLEVRAASRYTLSLQVKELNGTPIYHHPNGDADFVMPDQPGRYRLRVTLPPLRLYPGEYLLQLTFCESAGQHFEHLHIVENLGFESEQDYDLCARPLGRHAGLVFDRATWQCDGVDVDVLKGM